MNKVLIAVPSYPYVEKETLLNLEEQGRNCPEARMDIFIGVYNSVDPKSSQWGKNLVRKQNTAREIALRFRYTHMLLIEADVVPPINLLSELLCADKDVVSGWYYFHSHSGPLAGKPSILRYRSPDELYAVDPKINIPKYVKIASVDYTILGCTLIKREVLRDIRFDIGLDGSFSKNCRVLGFKMWVDTSLYCKHIDRYKREEK